MANSYGTYTDAQIMKCLLTKNFTDIGRVFEDDVVTKVKAGAFFQAQNLDRITLSAVKDIGEFAFSECGAATISLPWTEIEAIRLGAFYQCQNEGLPSTVNFAKVTVLDNMTFAGSSSKPNTWLQSISLPLWTGTTTGHTRFGTGTLSGVFEYCTALTSVSLPELETVPSRMFQRCSSIQTIILPKCKKLNSSTFQYCSALKKVECGGQFTSFPASQFTGCSAIEALILSGLTTVPTLTSGAFSGTRFVNGGAAYIYVPRSLEATVKVASNWSTYANQIRAIEDYPAICS